MNFESSLAILVGIVVFAGMAHGDLRSTKISRHASVHHCSAPAHPMANAKKANAR
jgi:hypothetical protein